jgi:hypothetical protein
MAPKKIEPAVMEFYYQVPAGSDVTVDLMKDACLYNRRFYRQGQYVAVQDITMSSTTASNGTGYLTVSKIPQTWVAFAAYTKAFHNWRDQQDEAIADSDSESSVARFRDFKVYADVEHHTNGSLRPRDGAGTLLPVGEWDYSEIVLPNVVSLDPANPTIPTTEPQEYKLHFVGVNNNAGVSRGIIDGYQSSRAFPQSPDPAGPDLGLADNWLGNMFNVGKDNKEVVRNAADHNDDLPYPQAEYPGGGVNMPALALHARKGVATTFNTTSMSGGMFACGLVRITNGSNVAQDVVIRLVPGASRGYLAQSMLEVN